jgi:hypothetical protein
VRVHINAGGREVTVECGDTNTSVREILSEALDAWKATEGAERPSDGPASYGFAHERLPDRALDRMGQGFIRPPKAGDE